MATLKILNMYQTGLDATFAYRDHVNGLIAYGCKHSQSPDDGLVVIHATEKSDEVRVKYKSFNAVTLHDVESADEINFEGPVSKKLALMIFKEKEDEQKGL